MEKNRMIYTGLHCQVNTKAAFVDMCMDSPIPESRMFLNAVIGAGCAKQACEAAEDAGTGVFEVHVKLDDEKKEKIYEEIFEKRLSEEKICQLPKEGREMLKPLRMMHQKEMNIDVIPFLACGIVRNSRSRDMLLDCVSDCAKECLASFRQSAYNTPGYLQRFLLDERKAVRLAVGLLLMLREEEGGEKYRMVMDIIYAGYRPLKNRIKKLDCLKGEHYREVIERDTETGLELARMVIQMVIAEDLGIPVIQDYVFCQVVCMLQSFEDNQRNRPVRELDMTEGKRIYRKLLRRHWNPGAYYISAFLEEEEGNDGCKEYNKIENLLIQFGLEIRALSGLCLEKWEAEALCTIFEEEDWERYKYLLLTATLCKYIQQIEAMYEQDIPEEVQYRLSRREDTVKRLEYEKKRLEERIRILEQQKKDKEDELAKAERQMERLRRENEKKEQQYAKERAEFWKLRDAVQSDAGRSKKQKQDEEGQKQKRQETAGGSEEPQEAKGALDVEKLDHSIVIGGHRNWQKKMRQCLPDSQFVASDHMNFDPAMLRNKKYIIVNTDILKHGIYYKIMSERRKEQKILYVHSNNIDRALQEIAKQL